jgi:hypothetical protein
VLGLGVYHRHRIEGLIEDTVACFRVRRIQAVTLGCHGQVHSALRKKSQNPFKV